MPIGAPTSLYAVSQTADCFVLFLFSYQSDSPFTKLQLAQLKALLFEVGLALFMGLPLIGRVYVNWVDPQFSSFPLRVLSCVVCPVMLICRYIFYNRKRQPNHLFSNFTQQFQSVKPTMLPPLIIGTWSVYYAGGSATTPYHWSVYYAGGSAGHFTHVQYNTASPDVL